MNPQLPLRQPKTNLYLARPTAASFGVVLLLVHMAAGSLFAQRLPLRLYTSADGMASSIIHYIARDSKGFLWFCGRGGLSRFDGAEFVTFRIADDNPSPLVHSFIETRDGTYWISTDGALYWFRPQDIAESVPVADPHLPGERRLNAEKVANTGFFGMFEDAQGRLWGGVTRLFLVEDRDASQVRLTEAKFRPAGVEKFRTDARLGDESPRREPVVRLHLRPRCPPRWPLA